MRNIITTISGHRGLHHVETAVFWIFLATIMVIAFGNAVGVFAIAIAIASTVSWVSSKVAHHTARNEAAIAPVTDLRPAMSGQSDFPKNAAAPAATRHLNAA